MVATGWVIAVPVPAAVRRAAGVVDGYQCRIGRSPGWTRSPNGPATWPVLTEARHRGGHPGQPALRAGRDPSRGRPAGRTDAVTLVDRQALRALADDLDDATGDLVCAALILGGSAWDGLARVLQDLAESVSPDVRGRRLIEARPGQTSALRPAWSPFVYRCLVFFGLGGRFFAPTPPHSANSSCSPSHLLRTAPVVAQAHGREPAASSLRQPRQPGGEPAVSTLQLMDGGRRPVGAGAWPAWCGGSCPHPEPVRHSNDSPRRRRTPVPTPVLDVAGWKGSARAVGDAAAARTAVGECAARRTWR